MKKILLIPAVILLAVACHKEPFPEGDGEYLVYTSPSKNADFVSLMTFDLTDSLLVIGQSAKPVYSQSDNALALIHEVRENMESRGFVYTPSDPDADLGIQMTYVIKTDRYVQYYDNPYWWLYYPGYWSPGFWGDWMSYYYPYPVTYTYSTNSLMIDMVNLQKSRDDEALEVIWSAYIGGPSTLHTPSDVKLMKEAIDQAFVQSPYISKTTNR